LSSTIAILAMSNGPHEQHQRRVSGKFCPNKYGEKSASNRVGIILVR